MSRHADGVSLTVLLVLAVLLPACAPLQAPKTTGKGIQTRPWSSFGTSPDPYWWSDTVQIRKLHDNAKKYGNGRTVAILDSGFASKQPDVTPQQRVEKAVQTCTTNPSTMDVDDIDGHGTAIAVIALGDDKTDPSTGPGKGGIAQKAKLLPIKIVCGVSTADSVTRGVDIAVKAKVDVILIALGAWPSDVDVNNKTVHDRLLTQVLNADTSSPTTLFVVASVWDGTTSMFPTWTSKGNVIVVAAMTPMPSASTPEDYYNNKVGDIWAPGRDVETAFIDYGNSKYAGKYGEYLMQGTSAAAAIVAGCAAAVKLDDVDKKAKTLKDRLTGKAKTNTLPGGEPRLDCLGAATP